MVSPITVKLTREKTDILPRNMSIQRDKMSYFPLNTHNLMLGAKQLGQICQFVPDKSYRYANSSPRENIGWQGEYLASNILSKFPVVIVKLSASNRQVSKSWSTGHTLPYMYGQLLLKIILKIYTNWQIMSLIFWGNSYYSMCLYKFLESS